MSKDKTKKATRNDMAKDAKILKLEEKVAGLEKLLSESEQRCSRLSDEKDELFKVAFPSGSSVAPDGPEPTP